MAAAIPIIGVGSLDLEAYPFRQAGLPVCALLEAGRGEAASALIDSDGKRIREDHISGPDDLLTEIANSGESAPVLFCGEGMPAWAERIRESLGGRGVLCHTPPSARAGSLAALAQGRLEVGDTDDLDTLQPEYLRMPSIGVPKRRDRRVQQSSRRSATGSGRTQ